MKLFHITPIANKDSIVKRGLKTNNDGELFLFEPVEVLYPFFSVNPITGNIASKEDFENGNLDVKARWIRQDKLIAYKELFIKEYAMFVVDVPKSELEPDDVAEFEAKYNHIYHKNIPANKVKYLGSFEIDFKRPWE